MACDAKTVSDDLDFCSLLGVLQSGMWLQSDIEKYLGKYELSHGRFSILLSLSASRGDPLFSNELATRLGVGKPTIAKMTSKLIEEGYLHSGTDLVDARKKKYVLTAKAKTLLRKAIPGYLKRLREMNANLSDAEKRTLIEILSKVNFLDPRKTIGASKERTITEKAGAIRDLCESGHGEDIDRVMAFLNEEVDLPTTKVLDFYLGTVENVDGMKRIEHYLFNGTQIQRNYCTLFFSRKNMWRVVNKAYGMGLIDYAQAYSR